MLGKKCLTDWFSIIIGVLLILIGIDTWLPFVPLIDLEVPVTAIIFIVVGIVGIVLGLTCKVCKVEKPKEEAAPPQTPPQA